MRIHVSMLVPTFLFLSLACEGQEGGGSPATPSSSSLQQRVNASFEKGSDWIVSRQNKEGAWESRGYPSNAYTAMCLYAIADAPGDLKKKYLPAIEKGVAFLLPKIESDGSLAEADGTYRTYATSLMLMALGTIDRQKYAAQIKKAQEHLVGRQVEDGLYKGGFGYGDKTHGKTGEVTEKTTADLSNTGFAIEALKISGLSADSEAYKNVIAFLQATQNNSETNNDPEVAKILAEKKIKNANDGGFRYGPTETRASEEKLADGTVILKSYGSMTYDGLKTYVYANLGKDDPRVKAAINWIKSNYTLERHPGFDFDAVKRTDQTGIYYYYVMMARGLEAYGEHPLLLANGEKHDWAKELGEKILSLQTAEEGKAWVNKQSRWEEGDPLIATSYALLVYKSVRKHL
ncbi:MAG: hypothetical protein A2Z34_06090 [Planctomycetes bacterium RBG_16_59_8]|nr:MAG: hypothetical protein A2Z34_06090 [Planctomycetes bacterium RBG_16_59_8]